MNQREAFEAWQKRNCDVGQCKINEYGQYANTFVNCDWEAWQAAWQAALASQWHPISTAPKVELQDVILYNGTVLAGQWWEGYWVDSCSEFIDPQPTMWQPLPPEPAK